MLHVAPIKPKSIDRYRLPDVQLTLVGSTGGGRSRGRLGVVPRREWRILEKRQGG